MDNVNSELIGNILAALAIGIPLFFAGYGMREILQRAEVNRNLEKAYDSIPPSVYKETVTDIIALADKNAAAVIALVDKHNSQIAEILKRATWALDYAEDITDGIDEDAAQPESK